MQSSRGPTFPVNGPIKSSLEGEAPPSNKMQLKPMGNQGCGDENKVLGSNAYSVDE
jgi:hypothetical protein